MAGMGLQGASGVEELQKYLRQRMLDQMAQQEMARKGDVDQQEIALRSRSLDQGSRQLDQNDAFRRDQLAEQQRVNDANIEGREHDDAIAMNEALPPQTAIPATNKRVVGMLQKIGVPLQHEDPTMASTQTAGYSSLPAPGKSITGRMITSDAPAQPERYIKPPSQKQAEAEETRTFRASESKAGRDAADARAKDAIDVRRDIAAIGAQGAGASRALSDQLKQAQIDAAKEKLDTEKTTRSQQQGSAEQATTTALDSVDKLLKHPGMDAATGAYDLRNLGEGVTQEVVDFSAERNMLIAALTLPNLGALKGPMSDKDVIFVKQLATKLGQKRMSKDETVKELQRARLFLQDKLKSLPAREVQAPSGGQPSTGGSDYERYRKSRQGGG